MGTLNRLTARSVAGLIKPGRHADGGNLYLNISKSGTKSWVFYYKVDGRQREMGLGSTRETTLARAREKAAAARVVLAEGNDPLQTKKHQQAPTFGELADAMIETMQGEWRNEKHKYQWRQTLTVASAPLRPLAVDKITTEDVLEVLKPIWATKSETASRLRGRIERVLDAAKAQGFRSGDNPARWRGHLQNLLPKRQKLKRGHHAAMAIDDLPAFMVQLSKTEGSAAEALKFTILTGARTNEVIGAMWPEIDFEKAVWIVPASRMKMAIEHRVPLSPPALVILKRLYGHGDNGLIFKGRQPNRPMSNMAMAMLIRRVRPDVSVHGFRSTFRDWASERTNFPHEVCESALAHSISSAVEKAYRRGDLFDKRRKLMNAWADYVTRPPVARIIQLKSSK